MTKKGFICIIILLFCLAFFPQTQQANIDWGGCIDFDLTGTSQKDSDSTSDLVLDAVELSLASEVNANVSVEAIIKYETGEGVFLDEGFCTLNKIGNLPVSVKAGQYVLPFGVFESHLINDPITQDNYEINTAGVTIGVSSIFWFSPLFKDHSGVQVAVGDARPKLLKGDSRCVSH